MADPPTDEPSLDPRTWTAGKSAADSPQPAPPAAGPGAAGPETTSFDPKTWLSVPTPPPARKAPARRRFLVAALIALAVFLAVGAAGMFYLQGRAGPSRQPGSPPPAAPPPTDVQRRALVVASPADIPGALTGAGIVPAEAAAVASAAATKIPPGASDLTLILLLRPVAGGSHLVSLEARRDDGAGVVVSATTTGFVAKSTTADLKTVVKVVRGEMDAYSFYSSAVAQHLTDSLISPFAQALTFDFDFQREIHAGDIFEAAFEDRQNSRGQSVGVGRLLYVSLETPAKSRALYWFQPPGGTDAGWFDGNGQSTIRSLMRTPVEGARISSTFGMRVHPVLGFTKMHNGIDFAAPIGTPIYAAGAGSVIWAAMAGTAGNRVILQHDNGWQTYYFHLNAFAPGIVAGVRVRQGQQIGEIGTTGRSTGPHLHYELHIDNAPVDPMAVKMESGHPLDGAALKAFFKERDRIDALRAAQNG